MDVISRNMGLQGFIVEQNASQRCVFGLYMYSRNMEASFDMISPITGTLFSCILPYITFFLGDCTLQVKQKKKEEEECLSEANQANKGSISAQVSHHFHHYYLKNRVFITDLIPCFTCNDTGGTFIRSHRTVNLPVLMG